MRVLLLAVFVGLACATVDEEGYRSSREYIYRYKAQLVTTAPQSTKLASGLLLSADLHLYFLSPNLVTAELKASNLEKMDKFVEDHTPIFFLHPESKMMDGIEGDINTTMLLPLHKHFCFKWIQGQVKNVTFDPEDPEWSRNIKRGILSLLVVNLDHTYSIDPTPNRKPNQIPDMSYDPGQMSYTVWEDSVAGYCKTTYTPMKGTEPKQFYLTKVRHYSTCIQPAPMTKVFNNFRSEMKNSTDHLNMQAEVSYGIIGNKTNFIIQVAVGASKIVFVPYAHEDGNVQTSVNQTLVLVNSETIEDTSRIPKCEMTSKRSSLRLRLPVEHVQNMEPYVLDKEMSAVMTRLSQERSRWTTEKMDQLLSWVTNGTNNNPSEEVLITMQTLMEMIRQSSQTTLKELFENVINNEEIPGQVLGPLKLQLLWELLMTSGTPSASLVLLEKCLSVVEEYSSPADSSSCMSAVTAIGVYSLPSKAVIKDLIELMKESEKKCPELYKVTSLALGSVAGRAEDMMEDINLAAKIQSEAIEEILHLAPAGSNVEELKICQKELIERRLEIEQEHQKITNEVKEEIVKVRQDTDAEHILVLESMRNAHIPSSLGHIKTYLENVHLSPLVRITAARAFEKFRQRKDKVLLELEEVLKNPTEVAAVRIQAFRTMVNLQVPTHTLIRLAFAISYEKEKQLSTYVWSTFNLLANSSYPPYRKEAARFQASIPFMEPVETGIQDSAYRHYYTELANDVGVLHESSYISDPQSDAVVDTAAYLHMFGATNKVVQVSVLSRGVMKAIKQLAGPKGFLTKRNSLFDLLKRSRRGIDRASLIDDIIKKLDIKIRQLPLPTCYLNLQYMNNVIRTYDLTEMLRNISGLKLIETTFDEEKWKMGVAFAYETSGIRSQYFSELPTECGFPVTLQMGLAYSANITGELSTGVEASVFKGTRGEKPPESMHFQLSVKPQVVTCLMGKMAVDSYIFQTGALFHALVNVQTPFSINASANLILNRLTATLNPPDSLSPVLKVEMKPYVYSRAVAHNIPKTIPNTENVNQRPIFHTMQPVMISYGAKMKQFKFVYGGSLLGYNITWQGEHLWRSLPSATNYPILGRSSYALYIKADLEQPSVLRFDFRYITEPRYYVNITSPGEGQPTKKGACDSWNLMRCYANDEMDTVEQWNSGDVATMPTPVQPILGIPPMDEPISISELKELIEEDIGHDILLIPSAAKSGFVAILNSSSEDLERYVMLKGLWQAWNEGQYHQAFLTLNRTAIPEYDLDPFKLQVETLAIFPDEMLSVRNLINPTYQRKVNADMYKLMKRKEHRVVNMFFRDHLFTHVNKYATQPTPSLAPQIMLDRIFPEFILTKHLTDLDKIRFILKLLLPVSNQLEGLQEELKNAVQIKTKDKLLQELGNSILEIQVGIIFELKLLAKKINISSAVTASTEYTILKLTQAVLNFMEITERGLNLHLLSPEDYEAVLDKIKDRQLKIYKQGLVVLPEISLDTTPQEPMSSSTIQARIESLRALVREQLQFIHDTWGELQQGQSPRIEGISDLINATAKNITMLNNLIKKQTVEKSVLFSQMILQAATQHLIIVHILSVARRNNVTDLDISHLKHYSLKVQTKELLERGYVLQHQLKMKQICHNESDIDQEMQKLKQIDRELVAIQNDHMPLPSKLNPWTTNTSNLNLAEGILKSILKKLIVVRVSMVKHPNLPKPCLMAKLGKTVAFLQQRIALFKATLLSQRDHPKLLMQQYEALEDSTLEYALSLSEIFDRFVDQLPDDGTDLFPAGRILISESMEDVTAIHDQQQIILKKLQKFLILNGPPPPPALIEIVNTSAARASKLLKDLKDVAESVKTSMLTSRNLRPKYMGTLQQQEQIYEILKGQLQKMNSQHRDVPGLLREVMEAIEKVETMKKVTSGWPTNSQQVPTTTIIPDITTLPPPFSSPSGIIDEDMFNDVLAGASQENSLSDKSSMSSSASDEIDEPDTVAMPPPVDIQGIYFIANITYTPDNNLTLQVIAKKSVEQGLWEMAQFYPLTRDTCVTRAVEEIITHRSGMENCAEDVLRMVNQYSHAHIRLTSNQEFSSLMNNRMHATMRHMHKIHSDRTYILEAQSFIKPHTVQAILDLSVLTESTDQYYMTPKKTMVIESVPLPPAVKLLYPFQNVNSLPKEAVYKLSDGRIPGVCKVNQKVVMTNDGFVFSMPHKLPEYKKKCPLLLAMDCSDDKTFAIILRHNPEGPARIVEILAEDFRVDLIPDILTDKVKINEVEMKVKYGSPIVYSKEIAYGQEAVSLVVSRERTGQVHVEFPLVGLDIHFDFCTTDIQMASVYKNQLCGLCGNYDSQMTKEMETPEDPKELDTSPTDFCLSYIIPEPSCQTRTPVLRKPAGRHHMKP